MVGSQSHRDLRIQCPVASCWLCVEYASLAFPLQSSRQELLLLTATTGCIVTFTHSPAQHKSVARSDAHIKRTTIT